MNSQNHSRLPGILSRVSLGGLLLVLVVAFVLLAAPAPVAQAAGTTITVTSEQTRNRHP